MVITVRILNSRLERAKDIKISRCRYTAVREQEAEYSPSNIIGHTSFLVSYHRPQIKSSHYQTAVVLLTLYSGVVAGILIPLDCQSISRRRNCSRFSNTTHLRWNLELRSVLRSRLFICRQLSLFVKFNRQGDAFTNYKSSVHYLHMKSAIPF